MDENQTFTVVINHEEQYAIWPSFKSVPDGWQAVGHTGDKTSCLDYIEKVWTDMRPLSIQKLHQEKDEK